MLYNTYRVEQQDGVLIDHPAWSVGIRAHTVAVIHVIGIMSFVQLERHVNINGQGDNPGLQ